MAGPLRTLLVAATLALVAGLAHAKPSLFAFDDAWLDEHVRKKTGVPQRSASTKH